MTAADPAVTSSSRENAKPAPVRAVLPQNVRTQRRYHHQHGHGGFVGGVPNRAPYTMSKAAVIELTKSIAADYTPKGIRVNAICPDTVESPSLHQRWAATGDIAEASKAFIARQPIGRIAQPEEVADLAVCLAGETFTTGHTHIIDGGWTL